MRHGQILPRPRIAILWKALSFVKHRANKKTFPHPPRPFHECLATSHRFFIRFFSNSIESDVSIENRKSKPSSGHGILSFETRILVIMSLSINRRRNVIFVVVTTFTFQATPSLSPGQMIKY